MQYSHHLLLAGNIRIRYCSQNISYKIVTDSCGASNPGAESTVSVAGVGPVGCTGATSGSSYIGPTGRAEALLQLEDSLQELEFPLPV